MISPLCRNIFTSDSDDLEVNEKELNKDQIRNKMKKIRWIYAFILLKYNTIFILFISDL